MNRALSVQSGIDPATGTHFRSVICALRLCQRYAYLPRTIYGGRGTPGNVSGAERLREQDATRNPAMWERWDMARGGFRLVLSCLVSAQVVASFVPTPARSCQSSRSCFAKSPRPGEFVGPGQRRCLGQGLWMGGPGPPPFWRTREELCTVRNSAR